MPRRPLLLIALLVLALHWLVLSGIPVHWDRPPASTPHRFSTRTLAAQPQTSPPERAVEPAAPAPARRAPPRRKTQANPPSPAPHTGDAPSTAAPPGDLAPSEAGPQAVPETPAQAEVAPDPVSAAAPVSSSAAPTTASAMAITPPGAAPAAASTAPVAVHLPASVRLHFDVLGQAKGFNYNARAELLWQNDGNQYQARQEISMLFLGSRAQTSAGEITAHGLLPRRFSDRSRSEQAAHFDFDQGRVTFSANTPAAPVSPGAQDRLSVFLQLGGMLAAAPERYPRGTQISITTVSARAADIWTFTVEGEETLDLPAGPTAALKLQRLPRRDYDQKAELWLAPALGYLPVRIRITQANGDFAELDLRASAPP
jgi:hypothetical protein